MPKAKKWEPPAGARRPRKASRKSSPETPPLLSADFVRSLTAGQVEGLPPEWRAKVEGEVSRLKEAGEVPYFTPNPDDPSTGRPNPQRLAFESAADIIGFGGSAGGGKAQDIRTSIPTPSGWTTMGALRAGDLVFSGRGIPCVVLAAHAVETPESCYRLTFDDGSTVDASAEHLWLCFGVAELNALTRRDPEWRARRRVKRLSRATCSQGSYKSAAVAARNRLNRPPEQPPPTGTVRTTAEMAASYAQGPPRRAPFAVPLAAALELPEADLPLDPYLLGVWLGGGSKHGGTITSADPEVVAHFPAAGFPTKRGAAPYAWNVRRLRAVLRRMGVRMNKHVPPEYLRASREQRLALLQGLMDTDGTVCDSGSVQFDNTNKRLIGAAYELIVSLGWKCRVVESRAKLNGVDHGPVWGIKWAPDEFVFRSARKRDRQRLARRRVTRFRYVVNCELVAPVPMRCITVGNPAGLYLCGRSMIPTHNSALLVGLALTGHRRSLLLRREMKQAGMALASICEKLVGHARGYNQNKNIWRNLPGDREIAFLGVKNPGDELKFKGLPWDLIGFDEADQFQEPMVRTLMGWNRTEVPGQRCRVVLAFNPPATAEGRWVVDYFDAWLNPKAERPALPGELRWYARVGDRDVERPDGRPFAVPGRALPVTPRSRTFIPSRLKDNPHLFRTGYAAALQQLPEEEQRRLLEGDFLGSLRDAERQVIPTAWVKAAVDRWVAAGGKPPDDAKLSRASLDASRGGQDRTVIAHRYGRWYAPLLKYQGVSTDSGQKVATLLAESLNLSRHPERKFVPCFMDAVSVGASPYDFARSMGLNAVAVNLSEPSGAPFKGVIYFSNMRTQAYWEFRDALDPEPRGRAPCDLMLPDDPQLLRELTAPTYEPDYRGNYKMESKDDLKGRLGCSPDLADAVVMCWMNLLPAAACVVPPLLYVPVPDPTAWR